MCLREKSLKILRRRFLKSTRETPVTCAGGEIPTYSGGDEIPVDVEGQRPEEEGPTKVVDLEEEPEDAPTDPRASRRMVR